jgi:hypothetical protein
MTGMAGGRGVGPSVLMQLPTPLLIINPKNLDNCRERGPAGIPLASQSGDLWLRGPFADYLHERLVGSFGCSVVGRRQLRCSNFTFLQPGLASGMLTVAWSMQLF